MPPFAPPTLGGEAGFAILQCQFKRFPVGSLSQTAASAALEIHDLRLPMDQIDRIHLGTTGFAMSVMAGDREKWRPATRESADHSLPFVIASTVRDGAPSVHTLEHDTFTEPGMLELMDRVEVSADPECEAAAPITMSKLMVTLRSGETRSATAKYHRGHYRNAMTDDEIADKYTQQANPVLGARATARLLESLWDIDRCEDLGEVVAAATRCGTEPATRSLERFGEVIDCRRVMVSCPVDVVFHDLDRGSAVTGDDRIDDTAMLVPRLPAAGGIEWRRVPVRAPFECAEQLGQQGVVRDRGDLGVEVDHGAVNGGILTVLEQIFCGLEQLPQPPRLLLVDPRGGEPDRGDLQASPNIEEVRDLHPRWRVHECPLARLQVDIAVPGQQLQRLTQWSPADPKLLRHIAFDDSGTRANGPADDQALQLPIHAFAQRWDLFQALEVHVVRLSDGHADDCTTPRRTPVARRALIRQVPRRGPA